MLEEKGKVLKEGRQEFKPTGRAWIARTIMRVRGNQHNAWRVFTGYLCVVSIVLSPAGLNWVQNAECIQNLGEYLS